MLELRTLGEDLGRSSNLTHIDFHEALMVSLGIAQHRGQHREIDEENGRTNAAMYYPEQSGLVLVRLDLRTLPHCLPPYGEGSPVGERSGWGMPRRSSA